MDVQRIIYTESDIEIYLATLPRFILMMSKEGGGRPTLPAEQGGHTLHNDWAVLQPRVLWHLPSRLPSSNQFQWRWPARASLPPAAIRHPTTLPCPPRLQREDVPDVFSWCNTATNTRRPGCHGNTGPYTDLVIIDNDNNNDNQTMGTSPQCEPII